MMATLRRILGLSETPVSVTRERELERERQFEEVQRGLEEAKARVKFLDLEAEIKTAGHQFRNKQRD